MTVPCGLNVIAYHSLYIYMIRLTAVSCTITDTPTGMARDQGKCCAANLSNRSITKQESPVGHSRVCTQASRNAPVMNGRVTGVEDTTQQRRAQNAPCMYGTAYAVSRQLPGYYMCIQASKTSREISRQNFLQCRELGCHICAHYLWVAIGLQLGVYIYNIYSIIYGRNFK